MTSLGGKELTDLNVVNINCQPKGLQGILYPDSILILKVSSFWYVPIIIHPTGSSLMKQKPCTKV